MLKKKDESQRFSSPCDECGTHFAVEADRASSGAYYTAMGRWCEKPTYKDGKELVYNATA